jgi:diguanylate cyclase (GGDEF)-like protein
MFTSLTRRLRQDQDLPEEIYASLVDSLYRNLTAMLAGTLSATFGTLISAWKTGDWVFGLIALATALVGVARYFDWKAYARREEQSTRASTAVWELRYALGAGVSAFLLGLWCFFAFVTTSDHIVHLMCIAVTIGNSAGVSGRNFGRPRIVTVQTIGSFVPLFAALVLRLDPYYAAVAGFVFPFSIALKVISNTLYQNLLKAVIATRDMTALASRFDTALNNMPHGLCMFDAQRRVVVSNRRLTELIGVSRDIAQRNVTVRQLLLDCIPAGTVTNLSSERLAELFDSRLSGRSSDDLVLEVEGNRALAVNFQPMENGGSVVLVEDITDRRNAEAKIKHMARYDALTGLPNRVHFQDQMDRALAVMRRTGDSCALLFIDLDQFKQINDTLGHACGDQLLCAVAERLRHIVRECDVVARFGGDEFIVLQSPVKKPEEASTLAHRIVDELSESYEIDGHRLVIGASIGIAMASEQNATADILLQNADMALYRAKFDGRGTWRFFEPDMEVKAQARRKLELDLRHALETDAFEIYYQPLFNLKTSQISTCEALLRWPHPERGMISPAEFIPVAEEMGLIVEIGRWVLRRACIECSRWPRHIRVAVNLSAIQFRRGDVVADIHEALAISGLPSNRLEVEITESVLLQDTEATRAALLRLRDDGIRISLDDFGTGYSSLSYLHSLPLHKVKIDRSFLQGLGTNERSLTLLHGVAKLSAELGLSVVIEGIETEQQLALISAEKSIDEAQGFLFSMPIPSRQLLTLLEATSSRIRQLPERPRRASAAAGL